MSQRLPTIAYALGLAGLIPFIGCGIAAISAGTQAQQAASMGLPALIAYAAVILSFLGAVHWGFALSQPAGLEIAGKPSIRTRLLLGIVPSLIGWAAMLLALALLPEIGLAVLIGGFVATTVIEARWAKGEMLPAGYMPMRWVLSIIVVMTLVTVLVLRLLGATIIF